MSACTHDCAQGRDCTCACACYDAQAANRAAQWNEFYRNCSSITMDDEPEEEPSFYAAVLSEAGIILLMVAVAAVIGLFLGFVVGVV